MATILSQAVQDAILASIKLENIESFDDEHDPEVYSTNINMNVEIDGTLYTVTHQRGTDGDVERAPTRDCGIAAVYLAVLELTGEIGSDGDEDDALDMFEDNPGDWDLSAETFSFGLLIGARIAQAAEAAQNEYDTNREDELVITPEFGVDASGMMVDLDSDEAVFLFEHSTDKFANMLRFDVFEKNDQGNWEDAGHADIFHFHLEPAEVYRRYAERKACREAEREERDAYEHIAAIA